VCARGPSPRDTGVMSLRIGLVEDDQLLRTALTESLRSRGLDVVFAVGDAAGALAVGEASRPDAVVVDLHLGAGPTGIDVAEALRRSSPALGVVILTSFEDPRLLRSGAEVPDRAVYLTKEMVSDIAVLVRAVEASVATSRTRGPVRWRRPARAQRSGVAALTDSQLETLRFVSAGHSNAEIARMRFVTEKSVEATVTRVAKSLGVRPDASRNQRVTMARAYFRMLGAKHEGG